MSLILQTQLLTGFHGCCNMCSWSWNCKDSLQYYWEQLQYLTLKQMSVQSVVKAFKYNIFPTLCRMM